MCLCGLERAGLEADVMGTGPAAGERARRTHADPIDSLFFSIRSTLAKISSAVFVQVSGAALRAAPDVHLDRGDSRSHTAHSNSRFRNRGGIAVAKILECSKVDPSSGCKHVVRGESVEDVVKKAGEHAKEHGIREVTPELMAKVKANIRDE
jgi:predicted small metal-binding protein